MTAIVMNKVHVLLFSGVLHVIANLLIQIPVGRIIEKEIGYVCAWILLDILHMNTIDKDFSVSVLKNTNLVLCRQMETYNHPLLPTPITYCIKKQSLE